jgi:hypothetical protein
MDTIFNQIDVLVLLYSIQLARQVSPTSIAPQLNSLITQWKLITKDISATEKKTFFRAHLPECFRIHSTLVGEFAKSYNKPLISQMRSSHDAFFGAIGLVRPSLSFSHHVTRLFTDFIKGVTFFANEKVNEAPIYHRLSSCGTGQATLSAKFQRPLSLDSGIQNISRLRLCFIEREIYNQIYKKILGSQDTKHLLELERTARLLEDTMGYPMNVLVEFDNKTALPFKLTITYCTLPVIARINLQSRADHEFMKRKHQIEEIYVHEPGQSIVNCMKFEANGIMHEKTQTFLKETSWKLHADMRLRASV